MNVENSKVPSQPFIVIAGDGNFQPAPLLARSIFIGVAQRNDVVVDFDGFDSSVKHVYLVNRLQQTNGKGPNGRRNSPKNEADVQNFLDEFALVRFELEDAEVEDTSRVPLEFREFPPVDLTEVRRERTFDFDYDGGLWTINGLTYDPNRIDAGIEQDSAEIWTLRNTGNSWSHPIHSHFTEFIILEINGVPQYQSAIQSGDLPRRAQGGFFQSESQLVKGFQKVLEQKKKSIPELIERNKTIYDKALKGRKEEFQKLKQRRMDFKQQELDPQPQQLVESAINDFEKALSDYASGKKLTATSPRATSGDIWFFYQLLLFLLEDEATENPKYDLISDPLRALIGVPGSSTPLEIFRKIRFRTYSQFKQAVDFMKDSEFWNDVLEGDGENKIFANLDLRGNGDAVKGDGRFMGGPRRDVALILPNWEVKVFMRWKDFLGKHVMHCHNVVHEDHAMMIRWDIVPPGHGFDTPKNAIEFYGGREEGIPHVQPAPGHSQMHHNDTDSNKRR